MNFTSVAGAAFVGLALASSASFTAETINPGAHGLILRELSYAGGSFTQRVDSASGSPTGGSWFAEITRQEDGRIVQLCAGSGTGVYSGKTDVYSADEWTGDKCPEILPGDIAEASWMSVNANGLTVHIGATLLIE